ncbi:hypothetical protein ADICEAN_00738 [Cesiribacter andamanensis AMV16]|uniref:Phosphatidate cytidylyltransferase n=1 Tax=Cesiribacter andamanensis AMV16 TaxID=1279009 RepID=M7NQX2_9BACT|nr:hypothetical protein ADICEAN_00738 [Cesiribacter andamanensis AMV16]
MKPQTVFLFLFLLIGATSCDVVLGIFEAGMWVGIIIVVLIVALVVYILNRFRRR